MQLKTVVNRVQKFKSFVYGDVTWEEAEGRPALVVRMTARANSRVECGGCGRRRPGYDTLPARRWEFIPIWNIAVYFECAARRVDCRRCGVHVERLPWASGKRTLTTTHMQFLAHWARKLSWKETASSFRTTWEKVCDSVEYVVDWGLKHREIGPVFAIGVDEIAYAKGHKYLTLVYQIDDLTRLLWVGKERTIESFEGFCDRIGPKVAAGIEFVCSDMWQWYLTVIRKRCTNALHILDRFHIVAKMKGPRRGACRGSPAPGGGRIPPGSQALALVPAEASGEPHVQPEPPAARSSAAELANGSRLPAQGRLPAVLGLHFPDLGRRIP